MSSVTRGPARRRWDRRWALVALAWALVLVRIGSEFTGRGANEWHHDFRLLYLEQSIFYRGEYPTPEARQAMLDSLVSQRLLLLHAKKSGLTASDAQLIEVIGQALKR